MSKIKHQVPYYFQENRMTCGVACARMVLEWWGHKATEEELLKEVPVYEKGTYYSSLALSFKKRGLKTTLYSHEVNLFNPYVPLKNKSAKEAILKDWEHVPEKFRVKATEIIKYINNGGEFIVQPSSLEQMRKLLQKQPLILAPLLPFIAKDKFGMVGHYVVVTGYDEDSYWILDPGIREKEAVEYKVPRNLFEIGWIANNVDSDAYLMEVSSEKEGK